jgi:hypothetical protein
LIVHVVFSGIRRNPKSFLLGSALRKHLNLRLKHCDTLPSFGEKLRLRLHKSIQRSNVLLESVKSNIWMNKLRH